MNPSTQAIFGVTVTPEKVQITRGNEDSSGNLTITVKNTSGGELSIKGIGVTVPVGDNDTSLAQPGKTNNIKSSPADGVKWTFKAAANAGAFEARPVSGTQVAIGNDEIVTLYLNDVIFNHAIGSTQVIVKIIMPVAADIITIPVTLIKEETAATVRFYAEPSDISPGQTAVLKWVTKGIDYCKLSEHPEERLPASGSRNVNPNFPRAYTLLAYAPNVLISTSTSVNVIVPHGRFWSVPETTDYQGSISLEWECNEYTKYVTLRCDDASIIIPSPLKTSDKKVVGPFTKNVIFTLTLYGHNDVPADVKNIQIQINPAKIEEFTASPDKDVWAGDSVTIAWKAVSCHTVDISPAAGFPSPMPKSGSVVIKPERNTKFTLKALGAPALKQPAGSIAQKDIDINVSIVSIGSFNAAPNPLIPAIGGENKTTLTWATNSQKTKIEPGIGDVSGSGSRVVNEPPPDAVYTLSAGTIQNPSTISRQSVPIENRYGPYRFFKFQSIEHVTVFTLTDWQKIKQDGMPYYSIRFTGVTVNDPQYELMGVIFAQVPIPSFLVLADPRTKPGEARFSWTDPNRQEGTITITGIINVTSVPEEIKQLLTKSMAQMNQI